MRLVIFGLALCAATAAAAPQDYRTTPVPILKQVNRHNDDGSYSFGYEGADGTFKIETKYPNGEVHGKYGYIGDDGKLREIEYGASKRGFEPAGSDINVAPPTLSNSIEETNGDFDDGQYREDPSIYYTKSAGAKSAFPVTQSPAQRPQYYQPRPQQQYYQPQPAAPQQQYYQPQPAAPQQQYYQSQPQYTSQYYQPRNNPQYYQSQSRYTPQQYYQPFQFTYDPAIFNGHPARNFDINTGSYSLSYSG